MLAVIQPLRVMESDYVFEGQQRHEPLSNMSIRMLFRRMDVEGVTVHGFLSTFRDWASEGADVPRKVGEMSLAQTVGSNVERAYARSDLLDKQRALMTRWSYFVSGTRKRWLRLAEGKLIFLTEVELPPYCFLSEAVDWVAFGGGAGMQHYSDGLTEEPVDYCFLARNAG